MSLTQDAKVDWSTLSPEYGEQLGEMVNFLRPEGYIDQVHQIAYDLAYGVVLRLWSPDMKVRWQQSSSRYNWLPVNPNAYDSRLLETFVNLKYGNFVANLVEGLRSFKYVDYIGSDHMDWEKFLINQKAFDLLVKPAVPPSVFIAYKREISTEMALLIEARLRIAGNPDPFVDKFLVGGDLWEERIRSEISQRQNFIIAIGGEETFESEFIRNELAHAIHHNRRIIPFVHTASGELPSNSPSEINAAHAIFVRGVDAVGLEAAISQLLNGLGYKTYG